MNIGISNRLYASYFSLIDQLINLSHELISLISGYIDFFDTFIDMIEYFIKRGNHIKGPYLLDDLKNLKVDRHTYIRMDEDPEWQLLSESDDLKFLLQIQGKYAEDYDEPTHPSDNVQGAAQNKSRIVLIATIVLLIFGAMAVFFALGFSPD